MAAILLPSRFTQQPQYAAPLDLGNPINRGLLAVAPLSYDPGREIVLGTAGTISGATRSVTAQGLASNFVRASSQYIEFPINGLNGDAFSLEISCRVGSATVAMAPIAITNSARTHYRSILLRGDSTKQIQAAGWNGATFGSRSSGSSKFVTGTYLHLVATFAGSAASTYRLYVNGIDDNGAASGSPTAITPAYLQIGRAITDYFDGDAWNAALFNRVLTAAEVRERYNNIWALYKAPARRIYFSAGGGGGATTIDLTAASFGYSANGIQPALRLTASTAALNTAAQAIQPTTTTNLGAAGLNFAANQVTPSLAIRLGSAALSFTANAITLIKDTAIQLTTAALNCTARAITVTYEGMVTRIGNWKRGLQSRRNRRNAGTQTRNR